MKAEDAAKILANRVNQVDFILHIMNKVYVQGIKDERESKIESTKGRE